MDPWVTGEMSLWHLLIIIKRRTEDVTIGYEQQPARIAIRKPPTVTGVPRRARSGLSR
jgi:hypothetical protein